MFRSLLCLILGHNLLVCVVGFGMLGPVDVYFQTIEECEDPIHEVEFGIVQRKFNRTVSLMDITVKNPYPIDDNFTMELKGSIKKEGGYKPGFMYMKDQACKTLTLLMGDMFMDMLHAAGTDKCPLPAGEHGALDFYFDNEKFDVVQLYGEYKTEAFLYNIDNELVLCSVIYYKLMPKSR